MTRVVIAPVSVAVFPEGGGHFWVFLQWIRGLQRNGCDVHWLECIETRHQRRPDDRVVATFLERMEHFGLAGDVILYEAGADGDLRFVNIDDERAWKIIEAADVFLNFKYDTDPRILQRSQRTALVDIDPGQLQFWLAHDQLAVGTHDHYFTTGEHIAGRPPIDGGPDLPWRQVRPVVDTRTWTVDPSPPRPVLTTITNWFGEWLTDGADLLVDNGKRVEFLKLVDLPRRTTQALELAVCFGPLPEDEIDRSLLDANGWLVRHSFDVSGDPFAYRDYVRSSMGEFSCVKPSCLLFNNAWISDRTLCYLASGRPAVVQHTGPSSFLPDAEGLFRFVTADDALAAFDRLQSDYAGQCEAARALAVAHFDAADVTAEILGAVLAS